MRPCAFGQGPERLGEQGDLITGEGQLVGLGAEKLPVHAHDVADVELLEIFVASSPMRSLDA